MTDQPTPMNVDPDQLRAHANTLRVLADRTAGALETAAYIAAADDGFGALARPIVAALFTDNHTATVEAIRQLAEKFATVPDLMNATADSIVDTDDVFAKALSGLTLDDSAAEV